MLKQTLAEIEARAAAARMPALGWVNGRWTAARSGATFANIGPRDGRLLGEVARFDAADVTLAVASARAAFEDGRWRDTPPRHKKRVLHRLADFMEAHADELALLETLDMGKPVGDAARSDIPGSIDTVRYYAEALDKVYGEVGPTPVNRLSYAVYEPLGVIGAIVPWNFPLLMAVWKVAPALAMGNSVVLKPAEQSPLTALRLGELASEAGLPPGVLNVVPGLGEGAGQALAGHNDVDMIAFTGSGAVGRLLMRYSGGEQPQAHQPGTGRQVPADRLRGLSRHGRRRASRGVGRVLQPGRGVHRRLTPAGRGEYRARIHRARDDRGAHDHGRRSA